MKRLLMFLTVVLVLTLSAEGRLYVEDFEEAGTGGFDPFFHHEFLGVDPPTPPSWDITEGELWLIPGIDEVTFYTAPGEYVDWASVMLVDYCGTGCTTVEFVGTLDSVTFGNTYSGEPETFETTGLSLGEIEMIRLTGYEGMFDDVWINVVGAPSYYVDDDGPGDPGPGDPNVSDPDENGSMEHPFDAIQEAIDAAQPGDTVIVAPGTYIGYGNKEMSFYGKQLTVRSVDPNDPEVVAATVIDCEHQGRAFGFSYGETPSSVLDGLTIANAYAPEGAIWCWASSPMISNCVIRDCYARYDGGGIFSVAFYEGASNPIIVNCTLTGNSAYHSGGAIYSAGNSDPTIIGCTVVGNSAEGSGGGIFCRQDSFATIVGCNITGNSAAMYGGGLHCAMGYLEDCTITNNNAGLGGGMYCLDAPGDVTIDYCTIEDIAGYIGGSSEINLGISDIITIGKYLIVGGYASIAGNGTITVGLGAELVLNYSAFVDLRGPESGSTKGTVNCNGLLRTMDNALLSYATINLVRAIFEDGSVVVNNTINILPWVPYGQCVVKDSATVMDNDFNTDGDRYIDLDPSQFTGIIADNRIHVTITEGQNKTAPGMFELRGRDMYCEGPNCPPGIFAVESVPLFDPNTWTIERLELAEDAKLSLANRFDFQPPYDEDGEKEVVYVRQLILGPNSVLNTAFNRLYYESLYAEPSAIIANKPRRGFSLDILRFEDETKYKSRVINNNIEYGPYARIHVERVEGLDPDPTGLMRMTTRMDYDPCSTTYGQLANARAKGLFAKSGEERIRVQFRYKFLLSDPNAKLAVYLSDVPELLEHDDPAREAHYVFAGVLSPPPADRPGSMASNRFGVFSRMVSSDNLNFVNGVWLEVEFIDPWEGEVILPDAGKDRRQEDGTTRAQTESTDPWELSALIDTMSLEVYCVFFFSCLDVTFEGLVNEADYLTVTAWCGLPAGTLPDGTSTGCLDGAFSSDGFVDPFDIASWDWALDLELSGAPSKICDGMPLSEAEEAEAAVGLAGSGLSEGLPSSLSDLLIAGKRGTADGPTKLKDKLYVFDSNGQYVSAFAPASERCNIRVVRGPDGSLYQINSETGVLKLGNPDTVIIPPRQIELTDMNEPRYDKPATVYVGIKGDGDNSVGRPILDAAFDANFVYVVPVVVIPDGNDAYAAAAKLELRSGEEPPYRVKKLYDDPPAAADIEHRNNLREIEIDGEGKLYVVNVDQATENSILWKYDPDGTVLASVNLDSLSVGGGVPDPCDPIALHVSDAGEMIYLASGHYNLNDPNATVIYGFSKNDLSLERTIIVNGMQHVTGITSEPASGSLWVAGFTMEDIPEYPDPTSDPFYDPNLAQVGQDSNTVTAMCIDDPASHDLALPMSIVWTGTVECGGADIDGSGSVNLGDFAVMAQAWSSEFGEADFNGACNIASPYNGRIDTRDLAVLAAHWLETGCSP